MLSGRVEMVVKWVRRVRQGPDCDEFWKLCQYVWIAFSFSVSSNMERASWVCPCVTELVSLRLILFFPDAIIHFYSVVTFKSYLIICQFCEEFASFVFLSNFTSEYFLLMTPCFCFTEFIFLNFFLVHQINVLHSILMFCVGRNFSYAFIPSF